MATLLVASALLPLAAADPPEGQARPPSEPPSWQYFCFESAANFAASAHKTIFSVLPDPEGGAQQTRSAETAAAAQEQRDEARRALSGSEAASGGNAEAAAMTTHEQAAQRLEPLRGTCYFMRVGYWTYEVCPWVSVRQYHSESGGASGPQVHSEHSLGTYVAGRDEFTAEKSIYTQNFADGEEGRSTAVRYLCPDSWRDEDGIVVVNEPQPKQYLITLRVQALCQSGAASAAAAAASSNRARGREQPAPLVSNTPKAAQAAAAAGNAAAAAPMQIAEMVLPNTRLLSSLRGRCFSMTVDYWTYEFCPQQHVRQFRQDGKRVGVEFMLGQYERAADKVTVGVKGRLTEKFVPHTFAQHYSSGTGNRRATVRVSCSTKNEHALVSVEEPTPHDYMLVFSSPLGCELSCAYAAVGVAQPAASKEKS